MKDIKLTPSDQAYHDYLRAVKLFWSTDLYAALNKEFEEKGLQDQTVDQAEKIMRQSTRYQFFGWFERHLQKEKYENPHGIISIVDSHRTEVEDALDAESQSGRKAGMLKTDSAFQQPDYYAKTDFHQHPGGVWRDSVAGVAYEIGRQTTMPLHVDPYAVHTQFAATVPKKSYKRILDLGCGTGRSTIPFAEAYPDADVYGIDLSAPCLTLAQIHSAERGLDIHWSQQRAEATDFEDDFFDLIHSTFLLHELPVKAVTAVVKEVDRLLAPGGLFVNLDFHSPPGGTWGQFIYYGHARRNNEVFMRSFCEADFLQMEQEAGLENAAMNPFDDGTGTFGPEDVPATWRFPFQLFTAEKPLN